MYEYMLYVAGIVFVSICSSCAAMFLLVKAIYPLILRFYGFKSWEGLVLQPPNCTQILYSICISFVQTWKGFWPLYPAQEAVHSCIFGYLSIYCYLASSPMQRFAPNLGFDNPQCISTCTRYCGHGGLPQSPMVPPECTPSPLFDGM